MLFAAKEADSVPQLQPQVRLPGASSKPGSWLGGSRASRALAGLLLTADAWRVRLDAEGAAENLLLGYGKVGWDGFITPTPSSPLKKLLL